MEVSLDGTWQAYATEAKANVWDDPPPEDAQDFYSAKFSNSEITPDWNAQEWMLTITGGLKFPTRYCRTVTNPRGLK